MRRNGVHQPYTEPKMKAATTKIRQQIIQATTYFKNLKSRKKEKYAEKAVSETENTSDKILLFEGCNFAFDLEDLLSPSAEILGKGTFGFTYIVQLKNGQRIVVKSDAERK
ncbi:unnamed protein product [Fraxinus pennsylvanica]|uniref:Uncharacterized protein n=1 Tax=Fraxinus pennsylvanica TaxID=56036 RepID=A0AAD1ZLZ1_9LAMI|nr:unnamed protein product [Fraxinus pennsylvanica]